MFDETGYFNARFDIQSYQYYPTVRIVIQDITVFYKIVLTMNNDFIIKEVLVHSQTLLQYAKRFTKNETDAQDLLQNTLMRVLRYHKNYSKGSNLLGWVYTIMRSCFLNDRRKKKLMDNFMKTATPEKDPDLRFTNNKSDNRFFMEDFQKVIETVPEKFLTPFIMHFEGFRYYEIADHLNVPEGTIKTRIRTARKLLKKNLSSYGDLKA